MDRKAITRETLEIMKRGTYETEGRTVNISGQHHASSCLKAFADMFA